VACVQLMILHTLPCALSTCIICIQLFNAISGLVLIPLLYFFAFIRIMHLEASPSVLTLGSVLHAMEM